MLAVNKISCNILNTKPTIKQQSFASNASQIEESKVSNTSLLSAYAAYNNIKPAKNLKINYMAPKGNEFKLEELNPKFIETQGKLKEIAKNPDHWINLPTKLLNDGTVDTVYSTIREFKKPFGNDSHLIFVALGNPANADEIANALGTGHNVTYCCGVRKNVVKNAIEESGGDLNKIQVIISSKSGRTFESNDMTYKFLLEEFTEHYKKQGLSEEEVKKAISKHFLCLTDKNPEAKLKKVAIDNNYKTLDCVDGLPSGFGDLSYSMPVLAYTGVKKEDVITMLKMAEKTTQKVLENPLGNNPAAKFAAFDKIAQKNGATKEQFIFHDSAVDLTSTVAQLYRESLRKTDLEINTYPRAAHSGLQAAIDSTLPNQQKNIITNVIPIGGDKTSKTTNLENAHIENAKREGHWQKTIEFQLNKDGSAITPESMGEFLMLKSLIAFFKNEFEETDHNLEKISYVKTYKAMREDMEKGNFNVQKEY